MGYSDEDTCARLMADLLHMAFVCDLTHIASLQITCFQSHMNVYTVNVEARSAIRADLHEAGHDGDANNRGQLPVSTCLRSHVFVYAHLLDRLQKSQEGSGMLLDQAAVLVRSRGRPRRAAQRRDSRLQPHSVEDMVMLVADCAGGLLPARHIAATGMHPARVLVSAMQAAGFQGSALGEVSDNLPALFG